MINCVVFCFFVNKVFFIFLVMLKFFFILKFNKEFDNFIKREGEGKKYRENCDDIVI